MAKRRRLDIDFTQELSVPQTFIAAAATTAIVDEGTAATGDPCMKVNGHHLEFHRVGNATNIRFVPVAGVGWTLPLDATDAEGIEITTGALASLGELAFVCGMDAFFIQATLRVTTLANIDNLKVGFRKQGAYGAASAEVDDITTYADHCCLEIKDDIGTPGYRTDVANAGSTATTATHAVIATTNFVTFRIDVDANGLATPTLGVSTSIALSKAALAADAAIAAVPYTFGAITVVPCIICGATVAGAPNVQLCELHCGVK